jgi:hypothetical protein
VDDNISKQLLLSNMTFLSWFKKIPSEYGYIPEIAPLAARHDLIFGGPTAALPPSITWVDKMAPRKYQWATPFCVSYTFTHLREYELKKDGHLIDLEPDYLGLASNTSKRGNSIQAVGDYSRLNGFVATSDLNINVEKIVLTDLPYSPPDIAAGTRDRAKKLALKGYSFLNTNSPEAIKEALLSGPIGVTFGLESETFNKRATGKVMSIPTKPFTNYHAVTCTGYNESGLEVFDSLSPTGYILPWGYSLTGAFVVEELPIDWKQTQETAVTQELPNNANRYGKVRSYEQEVLVASMMLNQFKAFNNKSVFDAAGRFWTIFIRAVCYDVINSTYNYRRTGKHIFDFDKRR